MSRMNYRSFHDLGCCLERNLSKVRDADIIVGIPRSGLLVANMLALQLHKPLTDLESFLQGRTISAGQRLEIGDEKYTRSIVIDDSALTGRSIKDARSKIVAAGLSCNVKYGCVYAVDEVTKHLDFFFELVPYPRVFEWNIFHHNFLPESCMDMDGCLCRNPTELENDDGVNYKTFLEHADPIFLPKKTLGAIVTCRLEKYREQTQRWLARHDISYSALMMMPCKTKAERKVWGHAAFKAEIYQSLKFRLFIESSPEQAKEINRRTHRPVFCVETKKMFP